MSITAETAKEHAHDPAVLCCRAEGGITIEPANLEDPAIFDELVDSGLLNPKNLGVNIKTLLYQVPGGMLSNLTSQLESQHASDKVELQN